MKQSSLVDASSHSRIFRSVFFLLFFSIFFVTTTNAQPQVMHRRLWPWPTWRPFPMIQPRPWPRDPPEPAPSPNPCPPPPPKPQPKPPPSPEPCPPPKPPPPEPCPPPPPKPQPKPPGPEPCPPPKPQPKPPAPGPEPCPPTPTPPKPQPKPQPAPDARPEPSPCPPKPPAPGPKPMPPPGPKPPKPEKEDISAVFFFGDSIFDTGNNNDRRKAKMKSNFRPYGINFKDGVATGRFGNGKVSSDYIAKYMGVKKIVPAYLDKKMKPDDLRTGVSFASGGAGYLPKTSKATKAIPMLEQLTYFQDYIEKVNKLVKEENTEDNLSGNSDKANKMISKGVAVVSGGGNDLINTFFGNGAQRLKKDIDSFTTMMADSAASFVLQLYEYGAKRIGVVGLGPLGCAPLERKKRKKKCNKKINYASQLFNSKLLIILGQLSKSLQNSTLVYMDVYTIMSQMIETPKDFGFEEIRKPCCKTGSLFSKGLLCKKRTSKICSNTSSYLFWDGIHPTKRALKTINKVLVKEYLPLLTKK